MRITRDHAPWAAATLALTAAASAVYLTRAASSPFGPSGGSPAGLAFGVGAMLCMLLAAFLSLRRKLLLWRIGSAQTWMKIHLWLGFLAVPLVLLHCGFRLGGALSGTVMILFAVVIGSGLLGLLLQHAIPPLMTARVPLETVVGQIDHVVAGLRVGAYEIVAAIAGPLPEAEEERAALAREQDEQARQPGSWKEIARLRAAQNPPDEAVVVRDLYLTQVRPYLRGDLGSPARAPELFAAADELPEEWRDALQKLADLCEECRQLRLQQRLHRMLHGWLFVHAPLSLALLVLAAVHALYALRY